MNYIKKYEHFKVKLTKNQFTNSSIKAELNQNIEIKS